MQILTKKQIFEKESFFIGEILKGKIFIYPTDTLYGLGVNALLKNGVDKVFKIKRREQKSLLVISPSISWAKNNLIISKSNLNFIESKIPGPYSFILELNNRDCVCEQIFCGKESLGIRFPNNWFYELISKANIPFTTTSVNFSGEPSATKINEIPKEILEKVDYIIKDDKSIGGKCSEKFNLCE